MARELDTVLICSDRYGDLNVTRDQVFRFEKGIVGFQDIRQYALIGMDDAPFYILHALEEQVSFILLPAEKVVADYGFPIDQETVELLHVVRPEEVATLLIVNIVDNRLYVNLKAPILLSPNQGYGIQFVIHDRNYPIRYPLQPGGKGDD